ncbi:MerR family transcriptional regulator [Clostridium estertheticum]|uniref:MerR family transcriptional regulator n=1 Tax=Clostridium estertheticum TaxID=238834 RepID=A0AA47EGD1_9CLOT|nr:MerR family transcriptional regulator [Clostridium estertheticum]MBU3157523.1 MerR family transcriptional regulator [Clostridium estertheticum]WAG59716.1 MerR family transcriptional regulator [Clostridium estertheticum]
MDTKYYKIEEVATITGLTKRTLRYYEELELIIPKRTDASYRLYSEEDIENINRIKELREGLGFCLNDVKVILDLEKDFKRIFKENLKDDIMINKSINLIKKQIISIEKKELSLGKSKEKFKIAQVKLEEFHRTKQEE